MTENSQKTVQLKGFLRSDVISLFITSILSFTENQHIVINKSQAVIENLKYDVINRNNDIIVIKFEK